MDFATVVGSMRRDGDRYTVVLPGNWKQGRTAYGGASAALALAATIDAYPDLPPLRSAQFVFPGPVDDGLSIAPSILRRGRSAGFVRTGISGGGTVGLSAALLFASSRESHVAFEPQRRKVTARGAPVVVPPQVVFAQNFEMTEAGEPPGPGPGFERWVRLGRRGGLDPLVELLLVADALPPAAMARFERNGPISTMSWQIDLLDPAQATDDGWWLLSTEGVMAGDGFSLQKMAIWNGDGRQVAVGSQAVALFV